MKRVITTIVCAVDSTAAFAVKDALEVFPFTSSGEEKMKGIKGSAALFTALFALILLAGCKDLFQPEGQTSVRIEYTVTFDADGGTLTTQMRTVSSGSSMGSANMPSNPDKNGHTFGGWYTAQNGGGSRFTADTPVNANITVYAKWLGGALPPNLSLAQSLAWLTENAMDGGNYTIILNADESIAPCLLSYSGKDISISLAAGNTARTISLSSIGSLFTIEDRVTLTLGNNVILQGLNKNTAGLVRVSAGGTLVMETGSKITGNINTSSAALANGGGVAVNGGTFTMKGGEISDSLAPGSGGGVYVGGGTFLMESGTISGNTASIGGGVYVGNGGTTTSGTFTLSSGAISDNTASVGGGVYVGRGGTFTQNSGEVSSNTAPSSGGGVYVGGGTFLMNGGEISGNTTSGYSSYAGYGGGVYVYSGTFIKQSGGTLYGSESSTLKNIAGGDAYGHAVYIYNGSKTRNDTAGPDVTLNSTTGDGLEQWTPNPTVQYTVTFNLEGGSINQKSNAIEVFVDTGASIGSAMPSVPSRLGYTFDGWYTAQNGGGTAFTADTTVSADRSVYAKWMLADVPPNLSLAQSLAWLTKNALDGGNYTIILNADEPIAPWMLYYSGSDVSITLRGGTAEWKVSLSSIGRLFTVGSGVTLTLDDNVTLQGNSTNNASLVYVDSGGTLVMKTGSKISGNTSSSNGGGVYVDNDGTFEMNGGEISGNTGEHGGGVYVDSSGKFTKSGGIIYGSEGGSLRNTASSDAYGHAVYLYNGSRKRNNTADSNIRLDSTKRKSEGGWESTGGIGFEQTPQPDDLQLDSEESDVSLFVNDSATFTIGSGYTSYKWYWDEELISGATSFAYTVDTGPTPGVHILMVIATAGVGKPFSASWQIFINK